MPRFDKIAFVASETEEAAQAFTKLTKRYGNAPFAGADAIVALGGDGLMLQTMHAHLNSRIPILVGENRERAILAGDNSDYAKLAYLRPERSIAAGDLVVTSGHGGAFPAGLPVGVVVSTGEGSGSELRVQPFLTPDRMEFVRLMDFGLTGVLQDQDLGLTSQ